MNPPCARCKKTVYPVEKLTCLDKSWHKPCFTCEVCNLKLTMKTYKGYNKLPYCNTHYPTTKFTSVADTPENKRLAQQSKLQSQVTYQKDHVESRGHYTPIADDVGTQRAQASAKLASNIGYQSEQEPPRSYQQAPQSTYHPPAPQPSYQPPASKPSYQPPASKPSYQPPAPQPAYQPPQPSYQPPPPQPTPQPAPTTPTSSRPRYFAMYDYVAADEDEVSFNEGDEIIEATVIDEGWMEGRVKRTGNYGMLPSNYVEKR